MLGRHCEHLAGCLVARRQSLGRRSLSCPVHAPFGVHASFMPQTQYAVAMLYADFGGFIDGADDVIVM